MPKNTGTIRLWIAASIWLLGVILAAALGLWNYQISSKDADNRLIGEAARAAGELAALISNLGAETGKDMASALINGAMEDERLYAVKITVNRKMLAGQRRNYLWEPVPWDDEITEYSIQGMNPVKFEGRPVGHVEVWLSTRITNEEKSILIKHESWRFALFALVWTAALLLLLWHWGELNHFMEKLRKRPMAAPDVPDEIFLGLSRQPLEETGEPEAPEAMSPINAMEGRKYQDENPDSWFVVAGMFRQTFARAPKLMSSLYADGEIAGLCHLGRMLEQAAPCVGAEKLLEAAKNMQKALNYPEANGQALAVEECVQALEEALDALRGDAQWQSQRQSPGEK